MNQLLTVLANSSSETEADLGTPEGPLRRATGSGRVALSVRRQFVLRRSIHYA
jgi:hypothetical protein